MNRPASATRSSEPIADRRFRDEAFEATWAADHDRALAGLYNAAWPGSRVMRARIYARTGLVERVLRERTEALATSGLDERAELALIAAEVLAARGDRVDALLALHAAAGADCALDRLMRAHVRLASATVELSGGDPARAAAAVAAGLELTERFGDDEASAEHRLEPNHLRARLYDVRARIHALRSAYAAQIDDLCRAISSAKLVRRRDVWHESALLAALSSVVGAFPHASARRLLDTSACDVSWNVHVAAAESAVRLNLARSATLFGMGDELGRASRTSSASLATRLALDADRLLFEPWNDAAYDRELDFTAGLAERLEWGDVAGDDVLALTTVAVALAPCQPRRAVAIRARYDAVLGRLSRGAVSFLEPRRVAFDDFVAGSLAKASGDSEGARASLDAAIAFWKAREMHAWVAFASLERYPLTHDEADLAPARRFVAEWPRSRYARRLRASLAHASSSAFPYLGVGARGGRGADE